MQKLDSTIYSYKTMDGNWSLSGKKEYRYSTSGKFVQVVTYDPQEKHPGTQWVEFSKTIYTYNDNDLLIEKISSHWDSDAGEWQTKWKTEYLYNNDAKIDLIYFYSMDEVSGEWEYSGKTEIYFNESGLESAIIHYDRDDYIYNNDYPFERLVLPVIDTWGYDPWWETRYYHMLLTDVYSLPVNGAREWDEKYKSVMHYSEIEILNIPENLLNKVFIYPNPAGDAFRIAGPDLQTTEVTVEIFDINGRKLMEQHIATFREEIKINASNLQSGMYICRLTTGSKNVTRKLIIR